MSIIAAARSVGIVLALAIFAATFVVWAIGRSVTAAATRYKNIDECRQRHPSYQPASHVGPCASGPVLYDQDERA